MTRDEIIEEIKSELGAPVVKVEIDDTQWGVIISKSIRWFKARKGIVRCVKIPVSSGQYEYDYPPDIDAIVDVILPSASCGNIFPGMSDLDTNLVPTWVYGTGWGGSGAAAFDASSYVLLEQQLSMRRRVFNNEPNWYESCGRLILTASASGQMLVLYKKKTLVVEDFIGRDEDLFYRYTLAIAKHVLGLIRRKYPAYPSAGGSVSMDGAELIAEALAEIDKLDEEITGSQGNSGGLVRG